MTISKINLLALTGIALIASGCMRFGGESDMNAYPSNGRYGSAPARQVVQRELPPPPLANVPNDVTKQASLNNETTAPTMPANISTEAVAPSSISGVWRASVDGMTCQIATPQTKFGNAYRAGPLHCPVALSAIRSWAIINNQLVFYDANGSSVATLYSTGSGFSGQTTTGAQVRLSR